MKSENKISKLVGMLLLLLVFWLCVPVSASADSGGFIIEKYDVNVQVRKNNVYRIHETIEVDFLQSRHGIYRTIPIVNQVKRTDGSTDTVRVQVENLSCGTDEYDVSRNGNYLSVKIGDEDKKISGQKTYHLTYDYQMGNDTLKGADEFYFNVIGTQWQTTIRNVTFSIQMPDSFDKEKLGMSYGGYGEEKTDGLYFGVDAKENKIYGELDSENLLMPGEGVNVRLELPEGYFETQEENAAGAYIAFGIGAFGMLLAFVLWWVLGRDDKVVKTMQCYPPDGMNSVEMMLAYRGEVKSKEVISLLLHLAQNGYIQIREGRNADTEKGFALIKLAPYTGTNELEHMFYDGLFKKKDVVTDEDLEDKFYKTIGEIMEKVNTKESRHKVFVKSSLNKGWMLWTITIVMFLFCLYKPISSYEYSGILGVVLSVLAAVGACVVYKALFCPKKHLTRILLFVPCALLYALLICLFGTDVLLCVPGIYGYAGIFCLIAAGEMMFFSTFLSKRTPYGTEMLGKIEGFKEYLETVQKERLEQFVKQDPSYVYDILPYAYVLGVSDVWMRKFESIAVEPPVWYQSSRNQVFNMMVFHHFMHRTMDKARISMESVPTGTVSGSSGGGFSGGGVGGGGGGSW